MNLQNYDTRVVDFIPHSGNYKTVSKFVWPARVYYEDTDSGGVVYHSKYLNYMERARTEWLRSKGFELDHLHKHQGIMFVVRSVQIEFKHPARFNQLLEISLYLLNTGKASMVLEQKIEIVSGQCTKNKDTDQTNRNPDKLLVTAQVKIACVNAKSFKPTSIPEAILKEIRSV